MSRLFDFGLNGVHERDDRESRRNRPMQRHNDSIAGESRRQKPVAYATRTQNRYNIRLNALKSNRSYIQTKTQYKIRNVQARKKDKLGN